MKVTKADKEYFKKLGKTIEKINKERLIKLSKLTTKERIEKLFDSDSVLKRRPK